MCIRPRISREAPILNFTGLGNIRQVAQILILPNGTNVSCRVIDLSQSGAAIGISPELRPPVGVVVTIGKTQGRVVRHIEDGFAIEFMRLQHPDFVEENVTGG